MSLGPDLLRYAFISVFGVGAGLMLATNIVAFQVLRPPPALVREKRRQTLTFLWWHVTAISVSFLCFGSVVLTKSIENLNKQQEVEGDWRTYVTALGVLTFTSAQVIIFNVERKRLANIRAVQRGETEPDIDVY